MIPALSIAGSVFGTSALTQAPSGASPQPKPAGTPDTAFDEIFNQVGEVINNLKTGETAATSALQGQMPIHRAVESIMTAERSLQTAIAIRDKLVSSYQTISQMPI